MTSALLVFDIDGTLVQTRAGRRAFNRAFQRMFGLAEAANSVAMAGRTDPAIFQDVCGAHGLDHGTYAAWKLEFLAELADEMKLDPGHVLPGVRELLEACRSEAAFFLALGTGNVEEGARLKLAPHDLNRFFPVGGFGTDGTTRDQVIAGAIEKARRHYGMQFEHILILGDTPHDISCGKANQALTIAVATGPFSEAQLHQCHPDLVLRDFTDTRQVMQELHRLMTKRRP